MKKYLSPTLLTLITLYANTTVGEDMSQKSEQLIRQFGKTLKGELQQAMKQGGPVAAIAVCKEQAPAIAADLSAQSGAQIGRVSLKYRNPNNKPAPWQEEILQTFDQQAQQQPSRPLVYSEQNKEGVFHYMKAIPTAAICLNCHGEKVAPAVESALANAYPKDLARGYKLGDIRGAFWVQWNN